MAKNRSIKWRIFNAAIEFLTARKFAKGTFGYDRQGLKFRRPGDMYDGGADAVCACTLGAVFGGAGAVGANIIVANHCADELDDMVKRRTKGKFDNTVAYNDARSRRKGDAIRLLTIARDAHA